MHQGLSKPQGCRNHPTAIWPLSRPPRPNRTWRPRQGGPNGQKPALYPVSGLIPVRTCHGPKCPPAQPPSGASGPLAAAILKRGLERPRRRAGSPTWGRARAGGRPLGCVARGRLRWGRGETCWGGREIKARSGTTAPAINKEASVGKWSHQLLAGPPWRPMGAIFATCGASELPPSLPATIASNPDEVRPPGSFRAGAAQRRFAAVCRNTGDMQPSQQRARKEALLTVCSEQQLAST